MSCNNVQILNFNHNIIEVGPDNKIIITDQVKCNSITIPQPVTNILQVNSPGPQGIQGPQGPDGRSYKVFTALVTQGSDTVDLRSLYGNPLTIGKTYEIISPGNGNDWTVVGAPNNNAGTKFIATGENAIWDTNGELKYDESNTTPIAIILENTIGNIWFQYDSTGIYLIRSNNLFTINKTFCFINTNADAAQNPLPYSSIPSSNNDSILSLCTYYTNVNGEGVRANSIMYNSSLEIRVYN
jgi:hypothetical protein